MNRVLNVLGIAVLVPMVFIAWGTYVSLVAAARALEDKKNEDCIIRRYELRKSAEALNNHSFFGKKK